MRAQRDRKALAGDTRPTAKIALKASKEKGHKDRKPARSERDRDNGSLSGMRANIMMEGLGGCLKKLKLAGNAIRQPLATTTLKNGTEAA